VTAKQAYSDRFTLDIQGLQPGIYFLRLYNGAATSVLTQKVLVE
jgi:hypothetical protein